MFLVILLAGSALGAISEDMSVYVRQDVLSERDRAFMAEIRLGFEQMRREMQEMKTELRSEMDKRFNEMHSEIQTVSSKVDLLDERTRGTERTVYWGLAFFGIFIVLVSFAPGIAEFLKTLRKPQLTIEDVKHLIRLEFEELNKPV